MELRDRAPSRAPRICRSLSLWFQDGNVTLQAEGVQFRVHRTILARQSKVLGDLLRSPSADGGPMLVDGCALIFLTGDSAADVRYFLHALYGEK